MKEGNLKLLLTYLSSATETTELLQQLKRTPFFKTRSKVLVILENSATQNDLRTMFQTFWSEKFANVVTLSNQNNGSIQKYTFNPFDTKNFLVNLRDEDPTKIFYNKFSDVNGHKLNILILKYDDLSKIQARQMPDGSVVYKGCEVSLLRCLVEKMNGTSNFLASVFILEPGERNPWHNGNILNYSGVSIKRRIFEKYSIDITNSEEMVARDNLEIVETLYPHDFDDLRIMLKRKGKMPYYLYLFLVFKSDLWIGIFVVFLIGSVTWIITNGSFGLDLINPLINMIRVLCGGSLPKISKKNSERTFLSFTLFFGLVIVTAFTSKLTTILMQDKFYPNYDSLEQLQNDGVTPYAFKIQIVELQKAFNRTSKEKLFLSMLPTPDKFDHVDNRLNNMTDFLLNYATKHGLLLNTKRINYVLRMKMVRGVFYMVQESPIPNFLAFRVTAGKKFLSESKYKES